MKKINILSFALFACVISLASCKSDSSASATDETAALAEGTTSTDPGASGSVVPEAAPTGPTTTIEFSEMVHDFGEITEGEHVKYSFKFKNTGSEPLIVSDAKGSCGCTVPDWPREPIAPGASAEIKIEFDSKGKGSDDGAKQTKKVTVTANTNPPQTYLTITGVVRKDPNAKPAGSTN